MSTHTKQKFVNTGLRHYSHFFVFTRFFKKAFFNFTFSRLRVAWGLTIKCPVTIAQPIQ